MERLMLERLAGVVDREVRARFPAGTVRRVALLQPGDDPQIGPDELLGGVFIEASGRPVDYQRLLDAWARTHETRMKRMRRELFLRLPPARLLEFTIEDPDGAAPRITMPDD